MTRVHISDDSQWSSNTISYHDSTVEYIYRKGEDTNGKWIPWFVLAPSAVLRRTGTAGLGLYVAKHTVRDTVLGRYTGESSPAGEAHPCIQFVNDRRNTHPLIGINCTITDCGYLRVTRSIMPAFNLNASLEDNIDSELRTELRAESRIHQTPPPEASEASEASEA